MAGGVVILLAILYFATRPAAAQAIVQAVTPASDQTATQGPPTFNIPPLLTLPPYNFGNAPGASGNPSTGSSGASCGCSSNACDSHGNNSPVTYNQLANSWKGITDNGDTSGGLPTVNMPTITPITIPPAVQAAIPPRHTYGDWYAQATGTQKIATHGFGNMSNPFGDAGISTYGAVTGNASNIPPGLSGRQIYFLYQQVNGNYLSVLDIHTLNAAVAAAYASPA